MMHRALYVRAGKRGRQSLVVASNCNNSTSRLYVKDRLTKMSFLVDTGADLCVYPTPVCENAGHIPVTSCPQLTALPSAPMGALPCVWILVYDGSFHGALSLRT